MYSGVCISNLSACPRNILSCVVTPKPRLAQAFTLRPSVSAYRRSARPPPVRTKITTSAAGRRCSSIALQSA